jgi:hypothetical protein
MFLFKLTKHEDAKDITILLTLILLTALTLTGMILYYELIEFIHTTYLHQCELYGDISSCNNLQKTERGLF